MEIFQHGKTFDVTTCDKCLCRFGFSIKDVGTFTSLNGDSKEKWVACPECLNAVKLNEVEE